MRACKDNKATPKGKLIKDLGDDTDFVQQLDICKPLFLFGTKLTKLLNKILKRDDEQDDRELQQMINPQMSSDEFNFIKEMYHTALKVRRDIQDVKGCSSCTSKDLENAANVDPERLYLLIRSLFTDDDDTAGKKDSQVHRQVLNLAQNIMFAVLKGQNLTPKHIDLN